MVTLRAVAQPSDYRLSHTLLAYWRGLLVSASSTRRSQVILSLEGHACLSVMMTREGTYGIRRRSIHKVREGEFCELRRVGVLRSSHTSGSRKLHHPLCPLILGLLTNWRANEIRPFTGMGGR